MLAFIAFKCVFMQVYQLEKRCNFTEIKKKKETKFDYVFFLCPNEDTIMSVWKESSLLSSYLRHFGTADKDSLI